MPLFTFPTEFVYWDKIENHEEIKKELLPIILEKNDKTKNNPFGACELNTSFYKDKRLQSENKFLKNRKLLDDIVHKSVIKMCHQENKNVGNYLSNIGDSFVSSCWWNVYNEKEHQEVHDHNGPPCFVNGNFYYPSLSMIYILHDENERSSVVFKKKSPLPLMRPHDTISFSTSDEETVGEGSIIIFPSNLSHLVKPCIKPGRVTIAYNMYSIIQYGYSNV